MAAIVVAGGIDLPSLYLIPGSTGGAWHTGAYAMASLVRFAPDGTILWQKILRQDNDTTNSNNGAGRRRELPPSSRSRPTHRATFLSAAPNSGTPAQAIVLPMVAKFSPQGQMLWDNAIDHVTITDGNPPSSYDLFLQDISARCASRVMAAW